MLIWCIYCIIGMGGDKFIIEFVGCVVEKIYGDEV